MKKDAVILPSKSAKKKKCNKLIKPSQREFQQLYLHSYSITQNFEAALIAEPWLKGIIWLSLRKQAHSFSPQWREAVLIKPYQKMNKE